MTDFVDERWGRESITYGATLAVVLMLLASGAYVWRQATYTVAGLVWIIAIAVIYAYLIVGLKGGSPEEALHYLLYGGLGVLLYRAFAHRVRDISIYVLATIAGTIVGIADETIQWLVPDRYFGTRDIWLNFTGVALVQVALAKGFRPQIISGWPGADSIRRLCLLSALLAAILGLCHQNTPDAVASYSERIPPLAFLRDLDDAMIEYGYRYDDPEIGTFQSRLTPAELAQANQTRAQSGAEIIDQFKGRDAYLEFLKIHTGAKDAFLHEARAHIFSRDVNLVLAERAFDLEESRMRYTYAFRQHQILERYFGPLYAASSYRWPEEVLVQVEANVVDGLTRKSLVSLHLVTSFTRVQALWFFSFLVLGLLTAAFVASRGQSPPS